MGQLISWAATNPFQALALLNADKIGGGVSALIRLLNAASPGAASGAGAVTGAEAAAVGAGGAGLFASVGAAGLGTTIAAGVGSFALGYEGMLAILSGATGNAVDTLQTFRDALDYLSGDMINVANTQFNAKTMEDALLKALGKLPPGLQGPLPIAGPHLTAAEIAANQKIHTQHVQTQTVVLHNPHIVMHQQNIP
jgi:hypothetical protein